MLPSLDVFPYTVVQTRDAVRSRRLLAADAVRAALERAESLNPRLNAFLELFPGRAMDQARAIDAAIARGEDPGPLAGVPVAIKDNLCLAWGKTTCGSRLLERYESPYTATCVQRLIDAGAVVIGKTNLDEFAMGSSGEHSAFGPTRLPWDLDRVPGGSSSGSAAAVAAGVVPAALGSDTGGSIRQPAGMCGVVGLKPTYGRVSRYGLVAFASSLDQVGPFARTVEDAAVLAGVLCGHDPRDGTSLDVPGEDLAATVESPVDSLCIGIPSHARGSAGNHPGVNASLESAAAALGSAGARIVDVDLPHADHGIAAYYIIASAEASSNLARFDGVRYGRRAAVSDDEPLEALYSRSRAEGFGAEVQRRIMLGTHVLSSGYHDQYYTTALRVRRLIKRDFDAAFARGCHALLMPASPTPACRLGEKTGDPLALYLEDVYTVGANLAGLPGITVPAGFATEGGSELPVGVQLIAPALGEATLLRAARMLERTIALRLRLPSL
ncbi:MAG: Asp-tRNA(Asn)/Glu-tRNA(Gln) amidotransferase subunit GatA [Phycisphaeraceae bacterium]|nr:Asp-tRNA(Asn)/Glu-tRNA(Gln) amidotransferase subunit GatA [Phycisphaeraceae bacterium]